VAAVDGEESARTGCCGPFSLAAAEAEVGAAGAATETRAGEAGAAAAVIAAAAALAALAAAVISAAAAPAIVGEIDTNGGHIG